jgi:hypothetical protein
VALPTGRLRPRSPHHETAARELVHPLSLDAKKAARSRLVTRDKIDGLEVTARDEVVDGTQGDIQPRRHLYWRQEGLRRGFIIRPDFVHLAPNRYELVKDTVKGGEKVRRVAGRSKTAALPEEFCENAWSFTALEAVEITRVSAERKGSVLQHGTVVGHSQESPPRGSQQASDSAGDGDALDDAGEDSRAVVATGLSTASASEEAQDRPYVDRIREILEQDQHIHAKQRHTAKRIWERLQQEGFTGGYTIVKDAVREIRRTGKEVFLPLQHPPGEAQVDFGHALVKMGGVLRKVCLFVMTLPYSDAFFVRAYERECTETFWDGHPPHFPSALHNRVDLLICDELGYLSFNRTGAELLFQVFADRYERASLLVTSNLPFSEWGQIFQGERMTAALLDRLTHHCHIFELNGESYRFRESVKKSKSGQ